MTPLPSVTYGWSRNTVAVPGGGGSLVGGGSVKTDYRLSKQQEKKTPRKKPPGGRRLEIAGKAVIHYGVRKQPSFVGEEDSEGC